MNIIRTLFFLLFLICNIGFSYGGEIDLSYFADGSTIEIKKPGTIKNYLNQLSYVKKLTIVGIINHDDIESIRNNCPYLTGLNLLNTVIVGMTEEEEKQENEKIILALLWQFAGWQGSRGDVTASEKKAAEQLKEWGETLEKADISKKVNCKPPKLVNFDKLKYVVYPRLLTEMNDKSFPINIVKITLPESLTHLEMTGRDNLEELTIPSTVKYLRIGRSIYDDEFCHMGQFPSLNSLIMKDVNLQFVSVNMQVKSLDTYEMPTYNLRGNTQEYHVRIEQGTKKKYNVIA